MDEYLYPYNGHSIEDIIERDEQTAEQDKGDLVKAYPYDPTKTDIDIQEKPMSIYQFMRLYDQKRLIIDPEYQRNLVWKLEQKSRFIESIILSFPLPPFYVNQKVDSRYIIIDGLQRTTTLHQFVNGEFILTGLKTLNNLNNKKFSDLPNAYQAKIEDKNILLFVIKPSVPIEVVYELFDRINTGGTPLNRQEVRNCIFQGQATELLKKLAQKPYFRQSIDNGVSDLRMKDRELILRYLAFKILDYTTVYQGDMSDFVEKAMLKINEMTVQELKDLENDFERVLSITYQFFGSQNFRFPQYRENGELHSRGVINSAMFESICFFFSKQTDAFLEGNKESIIKNFWKLLDDPIYKDAVRFSTGNKIRVFNRFRIVQEILGNIH
jgi:uncharacterized protein with ParB-like and HNH nuclease domain